jgi:hypothetical protein
MDKIRRRIRRIEATARWSRMNGWGGNVPTEMMIEHRALTRLLAAD